MADRPLPPAPATQPLPHPHSATGDRGKTKAQLVEELAHLRQYVRELESHDRALQDKERQLEAAQREFDRLVEERTAALKAANDELVAEIVDRTRAERALRSAKEQLQAILEAVPGMVSWVSSDLRYLGVNQHLAKTLNLPPEEFAGKKLGFLGIGTEFISFVKQLFEKPDRDAYREVRAQVQGECRSFLMVAQKYDGDRAAFVIGLDITERCQALEQLKRLASLDGLTQVANRRSFDETLDREWQRLSREQQPLALMLCDIDHFKAYNDTYGHQAGDDCLKQVAAVLQQVTRRPADLAARYGGEEFALILPNTPLSGAMTIAENARQYLRSLDIQHESSPTSPYITLSIGIACWVPSPQRTPQALLKQADRALYDAKEGGRDRVCWDPESKGSTAMRYAQATPTRN